MDFERRVGGKVEEKKEDATRWQDVAGLDQVKQALLEKLITDYPVSSYAIKAKKILDETRP